MIFRQEQGGRPVTGLRNKWNQSELTVYDAATNVVCNEGTWVLWGSQVLVRLFRLLTRPHQKSPTPNNRSLNHQFIRLLLREMMADKQNMTYIRGEGQKPSLSLQVVIVMAVLQSLHLFLKPPILKYILSPWSSQTPTQSDVRLSCKILLGITSSLLFSRYGDDNL